MAPDWFRSAEWSGPAKVEFEAKLARSRAHNRPQYLRVKAIALDGAGLTAAAQDLLRRVTDEYPESLDCAFAFELQGDIFRRIGDLAAAEDCYRRAIARRPDLNATSGAVPISLADVLLRLDGAAAIEEVRALLSYPQMRLGLNSQRVEALIVSARAAEVTGDLELCRSEAQRALDLLDADSQFEQHPGVGVPSLSEEGLNELQRLAGAGLTTRRQRRRWLGSRP